MLSIIINHYKSPEVLRLCLNYIKNNAPPDSEIIVSDSETIEKTQDMMHYDFPEIKFLPEIKNIGFAKSVNRGIINAHGELFLIINADVVVPDTEAIPKMIAYMQKNPDIGILGPKLLNINGEPQASCFRFYSPKTILARRTLFRKTPWGKLELDRFLVVSGPAFAEAPASKSGPVTCDWLMGSALLVRRNACEQVGPIDERYFMYMEDVDWCRSFWAKHWKVVYYPDASFFHYHFQASKKKNAILDILTNKYTRIHLTSAIKYFIKWGL